MKAVLCPVCNGSGSYCTYPPYGSSGANPICRSCHGCGGKGWVEVEDDGHSSKPFLFGENT